MRKYKLFIGGEWLDPAENDWFPSINPYDGKTWASIPRGTDKDVDRAVSAAKSAFQGGEWSRMSASARGAKLRALGDLIAENAGHLAAFETRDNGKLISEMAAQLNYVPQWYYYYGGLADKIEGSVIPTDKPETFNFTVHEPVGVVAAITPWNSPLLLLAWKMAPALAAGNTIVIKPSEHASASTLELMKLVEAVRFPPGVINVVTGYGTEVGEPLVNHPDVRKIAFTGSDVSGQRINECAAKDFKHVTMELGGKSPNIVFDDAKIENAVNGAISGIFAASGQTCIAGSRLLVQKKIHNEFLDRLLSLASTAAIGDPMDGNTQVGPVTTKPQFEKVMNYVDLGQQEGADCILGGKPYTGPGSAGELFVEPTIFTGVKNEMRIAQEEIFGPVLSVITFEEEEEALKIANDTAYGLAAGVWTTDMGRALRAINGIQAGTIWVNTYRAVSYMSPFGGYKRSGFGRENGIEAIHGYMQTKCAWISTAEAVANPFIIR